MLVKMPRCSMEDRTSSCEPSFGQIRYPHRYPLFAGLKRSAVRRQEPESPALVRFCGPYWDAVRPI